MIEPMAKIEIVGLMEDLDAALDLLQRLGTVEIIEIPTIESTGHSQLHRIHLDEKKEILLEGYEKLLSTVNELLDILGSEEEANDRFDETGREELSRLNPEELNTRISRLSREIRRLGRQRRNLQEDYESMCRYESLIKAFLPLLEKAGDIGDREQLGIVLKKGESSVFPILKSRIEEISGPGTLVLRREMQDGSIGVFIVTARDDLQAVRELLNNEGVAEYHIPREFRKKNIKASIEEIRKRLEAVPEEIEAIEKKLLEKKDADGALLRSIRSLSIDRINQLRVLSRLVRTRYAFIISGWTPVSSLAVLKRNLGERFGNRVYVEQVRISDYDMANIPTLLTNRGFSKAFEVLMKLLPPPKYNNLDATPFITLFFPLFFGIILGDMAYGLILMAIAGALKWRAPKGHILSDIGTVALTAGVFTVIFGFLYGEFLGDFGEHHLGMHPAAPWLHRATAIKVILIFAIGIGIIHILLGFILKTYVSVLMKHTKGVIESISKIVFILGVVGLFVQLFLDLPPTMKPFCYGGIVSGLAGVVYSEGFLGLLETFSMLGNILSYSRIMAIGLASVILAIVANRLAEATQNIILGIIIGFVIHLINFVMGVFSPTIHSLRLHYVEFFTKFFNPSGREFRPFRRTREPERDTGTTRGIYQIT